MQVAWYYYDKEPCPGRIEKGVVDIAGLDKVEILRALYAKAMPLGLGKRHYVPGDLAYKEAEEILKAQRGYIDYVKGRAMHIHLSEDTMETRLFNSDNGECAAEKVIIQLRSLKSH